MNSFKGTCDPIDYPNERNRTLAFQVERYSDGRHIRFAIFDGSAHSSQMFLTVGEARRFAKELLDEIESPESQRRESSRGWLSRLLHGS